jgi:hypothetical protein
VAGVVLAVMAAMAVGGVLAVLATESLRREQDTRRPPRREASTRLLRPLAIIEGIVLVGGIALIAYRYQKRRRSAAPGSDPGRELRQLIAFVAGLMGLVALVLGLLSSLIPREESRPPPAVPVEPAFHPLAPAQWTGLDYLPEGTNLVAGLHVAELMRQPAGRLFLRNFRFPRLDFGPASLEKWTGLNFDDIDHLVIALRVGDQLPPPLLITVQTRRPYDPQQLRDRLQADRRTDPAGKSLYRFKVDKSLVDPVLWCPNHYTVVVGLKAEDLAAVPNRPAESLPPEEPAGGLRRLPPAVQELIRDWPVGTPVWVAGHVEQWEAIRLLLAFFKTPPDQVEALVSLRTLGLSLRFEPGLRLDVQLSGADETAARKLDDFLARRQPDEIESLRLLGPQKQLEPVARELARTLTRTCEGNTVRLQAAADEKVIGRVLDSDH